MFQTSTLHHQLLHSVCLCLGVVASTRTLALLVTGDQDPVFRFVARDFSPVSGELRNLSSDFHRGRISSFDDSRWTNKSQLFLSMPHYRTV
ncbi:hypothetical protein B0T20DRAFT_424370 [Sordaria brevicollis]|uniref:Secreted protein n=1 Tax=Sordaria brevicollis TaxID=83679 RepID=A0AAE0U5G5_SORBR|nr:hypothetical protein B0T20DRAFT_424370 [Sordaria brevicollis]